MQVTQREIDQIRQSCALRLELAERVHAKHPDAGPPNVLLDVSLVVRLCTAAETLLKREALLKEAERDVQEG